MKRNYVAPLIALCEIYEDAITTSAVPEGVDLFDTGWLS